MKVDNIHNFNSSILTKPSASETIDLQRKQKDSADDSPQSSPIQLKIQPEELLDKIKALTQDGQYSVRFEQNESEDLIVKIFDNETQEVIRQIPPEELLNFQETFKDLVGNLVNTES